MYQKLSEDRLEGTHEEGEVSKGTRFRLTGPGNFPWEGAEIIRRQTCGHWQRVPEGTHEAVGIGSDEGEEDEVVPEVRQAHHAAPQQAGVAQHPAAGHREGKTAWPEKVGHGLAAARARISK